VPAFALVITRWDGPCWLEVRTTELALRYPDKPGDVDNERLIVPEKPPWLANVMSAAPWEPAWLFIKEGPLMLKSTTYTVTTTEWDVEPEVPTTLKVKDPAFDELTVNVTVPGPDGDKVTVRGFKLAAALLATRFTIPLKLLTLVNVRVVEFEEPACTVSEEEPTAKTKSGAEPMVIDIVAE
jgi:hypothetical protein